MKGTDLFFGVYELVKNWRETYAALEQLATSPEFRQQFGDNYLKGLEERAAFLTRLTRMPAGKVRSQLVSRAVGSLRNLLAF
ncbi:hypothetical protein PAPB9_06229 [Pseudomonas aeruginosa]|nr:hypothetical protein PAPB9_06229 [Pseudomonas aeruginosa]